MASRKSFDATSVQAGLAEAVDVPSGDGRSMICCIPSGQPEEYGLKCERDLR